MALKRASDRAIEVPPRMASNQYALCIGELDAGGRGSLSKGVDSPPAGPLNGSIACCRRGQST